MDGASRGAGRWAWLSEGAGLTSVPGGLVGAQATCKEETCVSGVLTFESSLHPPGSEPPYPT